MAQKLTHSEKDVITNGFGNNEYENDGSHVWSWSIQPNCKDVTEAQIGGVIGSLVKKGLAEVADWDGGFNKDSTVGLTDSGKVLLDYYTR